MSTVGWRRNRRWGWAFRVAVGLGLMALLPGLAGCVTNPATGERVFNTLSEEKEIAMGEQAQEEFISTNGGNVPDAALLAYVRGIGEGLAAVSERPELPWEFHVLDSAQINAFALPGGKVFMSRGLMERMTNEAQLAGVLGHEIGHVTSLHVGRRLSHQQLLVVGGATLAVIGGATDEDWVRWAGLGVTVGGSLVYLPRFSRDNETEADALGVRYMTAEGYNPYGQVQVMEILKEAAGSRSAGNLIQQMTSTHPLAEDRIEDLLSLIGDAYPQAQTQANSGEGFFEDRFERQALARLRALPAPSHDPSEKEKAAVLRAYQEHLLAADGCGEQGCPVDAEG